MNKLIDFIRWILYKAECQNYGMKFNNLDEYTNYKGEEYYRSWSWGNKYSHCDDDQRD